MANRSIQQKIIKMKRMRRAWAKSYSMKNTGPVKNPVIVEKYHEDGEDKLRVTEVSIGARNKSASRTFSPSSFGERLLVHFQFNEKDPECIYARRAGLHTDLVILGKLVHSKSSAGSLQGEIRFAQHIFIDTPELELRLFMGGDEVFFVEERRSDGKITQLRSINYVDKKYAIDAYQNGEHTIMWKEIFEFPPK